MSQLTDNYGLILEDNDKTKFKIWREAINGTVNSNMIKIDSVLAQKSDKSVSVSCTLLASAWTGVDSPFVQELAVTGLGALQNGDISVAHSATFDEREMAREAKLCVTGQSAGMLVISADGELPDIDIPVIITLLG